MSREKVANRISDILNPYYSSAFFFLVVSLIVSPSFKIAVLHWVLMATFFSFIPIIDIKRRIKLKIVKDIHISHREDRIKPFIVSLISAIAGLLTIYIADAPLVIKALSWTIVLTGAAVTIITLFWKISLHAAGVCSIATVLIILLGKTALFILILIPVVFWARLTLKKHTFSQLIAGSVLSSVIAILVYWIFGLI